MFQLSEPTKDQIKYRAYALYLMRGCEPGKDVEDWVRAEKELDDQSDGARPPLSAARLGELRYPWPAGI